MGQHGRSTRCRRGATKVEYALVCSAILIAACVFAAASTPTPQLFDRVAVDISDVTEIEIKPSHPIQPIGSQPIREITTEPTSVSWGGPVETMPMLSLSVVFLLLLGCTWFVLKFA